ncbi:MAG: tRNA 4-thiouridine(8) synthase ThiI [Spirochaetes bacterium]|nr:tRNA 4-thiouridine(8) synthase ThiI [Spirochaetota bacterium]
MTNLILIKYGEISLKKGNRKYFEKKLVSNIKLKFSAIKINIIRHQGRFYIEYPSGQHDRIISGLKEIFGIIGFAPALKVHKEMEEIKKAAGLLAAPSVSKDLLRFKIEARRTDKSFPFNSYKIACELGDFLLSKYKELTVDVHKPDWTVNVEIREYAYLYAGQIKGPGGLPVGVSGRGILLLSGGIDSPVAGYYMAKRGLTQEAIYFDSPPYTSVKALDKVVKLSRLLSGYIPKFVLNILPFTAIQERIKEHSQSRAVTLMMRAAMVAIACKLAKQKYALCLVTGESLGQVASQTPESIRFSGSKSDLPVFRPLIGMDKEEIINIARNIGTFRTSILPYEDCCTLFAPVHPIVKPVFKDMEAIYKSLNLDDLIEEAIDKIKIVTF